ncbi:MAG: hypothetical protein ABI051_10360 [Vicinamibacterales bacterium]
MRRAEGRVVDALFAFALKRFGKPFFEHAWLDFWAGEPPDADEFTDIPEFDSMFVPWFVTGFIRDPHGEGIEPDWPDEPVGLYWLRTEQPLIDALERAWVTAACASPMSVFVVEGVEPGLSLDIRDLFTGRRFHGLEQSASRTVHRTDLLFVRVVTAGGVCLMFGMAPLAVPARLHLSILDWRDRVFRRRTPTRHDLMDCDVEIRDLYLELAPEIRNPVMPQLRNTDGDPLEPTTLVYDLTTAVADVFERLRPLEDAGRGRACERHGDGQRGHDDERRRELGQSRQSQDERVGQHDPGDAAPHDRSADRGGELRPARRSPGPRDQAPPRGCDRVAGPVGRERRTDGERSSGEARPGA